MSHLLTAGILQQQSNLAQKQYSLNFDGDATDDRVQLPSIQDTKAITLEFKIRPTTLIQDTYIVSKSNNSGNQTYNIYFFNSIGFGFQIRNPSGEVIANPQIPISNFQANVDANIAVTSEGISGGLCKIFVNGVEEDSVTISGGDFNYLNSPVYLSASAINPLLRNFNGLISEARFWNSVRTQQEIQDNLNKKLAGNEADLLWYGNFLVGSGNVLPDLVNGQDGTIYGATWVEL